jgi:hypothetical protein
VSVGAGGAWTIPLQKRPTYYLGLTQDLGGSVIVEVRWSRAFVQGELQSAGVLHDNPSFRLWSARAGALILQGEPDVLISAGIGHLGDSAKSDYECQYGCDRYEGSGLAWVAEAEMRLSVAAPLRAGVFAQAIVPRFQIHQFVYPGAHDVDPVPVISPGLRLFL